MVTSGSLKKRVVFIVNPISGKGEKQGIERMIADHIDTNKYQWEVIHTTGPDHATEISRKAALEGVDVVVAIGGDGTVNEVTAGLVGTATALGIIPAGSGNGLSRHLRIPAKPKKAIAIINRCKIIKIDTATIDGNIFVNLAGVGFDATVADKFSKAGSRGFSTYFRITARSYMNYKPKKYTMIIDGVEIKRRALMVSFANSSQFGNNASINPGADVSDGFIDVCILGKIPFWKAPFIAPLLFMKKFDQTRYVEIIRAREVILKQKKERVIHIDGDPRLAGKELTMKIDPLSLNVIVP